jgi:hypothetical protein
MIQPLPNADTMCILLAYALHCRFHPIHMHLVDFFVLQRGNVAGIDGLFAFERNAAKDIIFLGPSQEIWVIARCAAL